MKNQFLVGMMIFVYLCISAYLDLRYKRIPWCVQGMGIIFMCICMLVQRNEIDVFYFVAFLPGIFLLLLSWVAKESIGYADGVCVLILGGMTGFRNCLWVVCIGMLFLSIVGVVLLLAGRVNRKSKIPFLPFLFVAESFAAVVRIM